MRWQGSAPALLFLLAVALLPGEAQGYFRGDPVQLFKRIQYEQKRTVWSDVLVGQAPMFAVDRAIDLHLPSQDVPSWESLKLQLSYDTERFTSEWITVGDGKEHALDLINVVFIYSGSDIHEVQHRLTYRKIDINAPGVESKHQEKVTVAYHWIQELETDTRSGLNFLFVAGCFLTVLAVLAVALDSGDLAHDRSLLIPEYDEDAGGSRTKVKSFVLFESNEGEDKAVRGDQESGVAMRNIDAPQSKIRARGGAAAAGDDAEAGAAPTDKEGGKAD
ncbi:hypothetical protein T484DRAFT_1953630 [Baffinella frigidus]|nr:hypothetical protein T484DRAFT_1953630 [Cryptophyta sp. CCMP2293]|mmetsp:Transcript_9273/g.20540  ORF Transcript_9273/g.20540 Transcript_9273/m.20540 type:complete len:276 (-) Transcript_9273:36-863(-)